MLKRDLDFRSGQAAFTLVVRAIIIYDNKILVVHNPEEDYYYPVGGCIHANESSFDAVMREVSEETGLNMDIDRFGFVHENFYTRQDIRYHEIGFYYYMRALPKMDEMTLVNSKGDELCWLSLDQLSGYELYPTFFKTRLLHPSENIEHIFTWENAAPGLSEYEY